MVDYIEWLLKSIIVLFILGIIIVPICSIYYYVSWKYPIYRDVWDKLDRAQTSAEAEDMLIYVTQAINSLQNYKGLFSDRPQTQGHCAMIFKKPSNDLSAQYRILQNIKTRLERTVAFDKNSVEYQSAIDDIRGTIREIPYLHCWIWHWD